MGDRPTTRYARNGDVHIAYQVVGDRDRDGDLLAGSDVGFEDRSEHELKGVPGTWRLFAAAAAAGPEAGGGHAR